MPRFVDLLVNHRPKALSGKSLQEAVSSASRRPEHLRACYQSWRNSPQLMQQAQPSLAFAVIGQAKVDGAISPNNESKVIGDLLKLWALKITLDTSAICSTMPSDQRFAAAV